MRVSPVEVGQWFGTQQRLVQNRKIRYVPTVWSENPLPCQSGSACISFLCWSALIETFEAE